MFESCLYKVKSIPKTTKTKGDMMDRTVNTWVFEDHQNEPMDAKYTDCVWEKYGNKIKKMH